MRELADGRDCLVAMPSGAGKSAVYQGAALAPGGPAVVVSRWCRCSAIGQRICARTA